MKNKWLRTDWKLGISNLKKESKFTEAHWINVIMFCHYFAVLCSLLSAGAGFFLGRRVISRTCAHEKRGGCLSHKPCPSSKNAHLLPVWVKARPKTSLKSWLVKGGWVGGGMIRLVICPWSLVAEFRHCFSTPTYLGLFSKQRSAIADLHCMLWKADLLQSTKGIEVFYI